MIPCITDLRIPCRDELTSSVWNYIVDKKDQGGRDENIEIFVQLLKFNSFQIAFYKLILLVLHTFILGFSDNRK